MTKSKKKKNKAGQSLVGKSNKGKSGNKDKDNKNGAADLSFGAVFGGGFDSSFDPGDTLD